ncbi:hypothetical protein [Rickettsia endosymbiont of Gonocerus acuteangulatus]|uniref:hypothetical protein n=1 Tax=Rickettsia endosymbiont of Gonocerus acuteangulatus TaxID=3066266 RepID=UPI003132F75C
MRNTKQIEIARSQYSGATGRVTKGIGVVSLVYYNPDINKFWVIDYRIFAPDHDGATKLEHLLNMLNNAAKLTLCYSKYAKNPYYKAMFLQCITL